MEGNMSDYCDYQSQQLGAALRASEAEPATLQEVSLTRKEILMDVPLMVNGVDLYNEEETKEKITLVLVYNLIQNRELKYSSLMKPLDKSGVQKSKFFPLTTAQLKECSETASSIVDALQEKERLDAERERKGRELSDSAANRKKEADELAKYAVVLAKAEEIYRSGKFMQYCKETFGKVWYQDGYILEAVMYQAAVARVKNADDGIHLHIAGDTQIGKSESVKAALQFVHPGDRLNKRFSKAWIYYAKDIHDRTILFSDDTSFTPEEAEFFRSILTSWKTGCDRGTVRNQEAIDQHIPSRVSLILTSIESVCKETDEGQDESRYLSVKISRTKEDQKAIREFIQEPHPDISGELETIYAVWDIISTDVEVKQHKVVETDVPFREFKRFLALIKARALLMGRTETIDDDIDAIQKFLKYSNPMIDSTTAGFTTYEKMVDACLVYDAWLTVPQIQEKTGLKFYIVARALRGSRGTFQSPSGGLLVKSKIKMTTERREYENNITLFKKFVSGGSVTTHF